AGSNTTCTHADTFTWSLQTILVGDSGVGKTSLLVQFDQGKFIPGSFSATVGIGFTVRPQSLVPGLCTQPWGAALFG
ncbi:RAB26 protein, partial [Sakesphorus luctuosus]|nr:RAB26 protein [Sakesphorus luctuosus]